MISPAVFTPAFIVGSTNDETTCQHCGARLCLRPSGNGEPREVVRNGKLIDFPVEELPTKPCWDAGIECGALQALGYSPEAEA